MGVHCYLTELGTLVAMAAKIVALATIVTISAADPGYGYSSGVSYYHRSPQGVQGYGYGGYHKRSADPGYGGYYTVGGHGHGGSSGYGYGSAYYEKRSAAPQYSGYYATGGYGHGGSSGYGYGSAYYEKRSAAAQPGYGSASVHVEQKDHGYGYPESYEYGYN